MSTEAQRPEPAGLQQASRHRSRQQNRESSGGRARKISGVLAAAGHDGTAQPPAVFAAETILPPHATLTEKPSYPKQIGAKS